jgi:hypothetical protein
MSSPLSTPHEGRTEGLVEDENPNDQNAPFYSLPELKTEHRDQDNSPSTAPTEEEDVETNAEVSTNHRNAIAKEDFSVFTVPQIKAIVIAGSFLGLFSPVRPNTYCKLR